jgi:hypothetical protein
MITQQRLRELLNYDPATGDFTWIDYAAARQTRGAPAGCPNEYGYRLIRLDGRIYRAHRLAWLYVHGHFPVGLLDHRDTDPSNNRFDNLRAATHSLNKANRKAPRSNTSGFKGVGKIKGSSRWAARITIDGKQKHIGMFDTPELASAAYFDAAREAFGEFARAA